MYSVQAGSRFDPVASKLPSQSHFFYILTHAHTCTFFFFLTFSRLVRRAARAARCSRRPTYNNASTLYRSTGLNRHRVRNKRFVRSSLPEGEGAPRHQHRERERGLRGGELRTICLVVSPREAYTRYTGYKVYIERARRR